ncbi:TrfB-related DNA-binding protein, partial [Acinetobacter baumannii]
MTPKGKYSLTQEQFEALRPYLSKRWEQVSLDAAYRLMVLGESPDEIHQANPDVLVDHLIAVVQEVWTSHQTKGTTLTLDKTPPGWVSLTVTLPKDKAREVELMEREAKALLKVKKS